MIAFEKFLEENPDMAEKPYGDAMAAHSVACFPARPIDLGARAHERAARPSRTGFAPKFVS